MSRSRTRIAAPWVGAVLVTAVACLVVRDHTRLDSASYDEPVHIRAGWRQVARHDGLSNIEHPPLVKELAGWSVARLHPIDAPEGPFFDFATSAHRFLFENRVSPDRILAAGRAPMLLFFAALVLLVFGAAKAFFGVLPAFFAATLVAFEPVLLAHAGIVQTDLPVALFWLASVLAWGRLLERRTAGRIAAAGVLLGLALATKFSAVYLLPTFALISLSVRLGEARRNGRPAAGSPLAAAGREIAKDGLAGAVATAIALAVLVAAYFPTVSGVTVADQQAVIRFMVGIFGRDPGLAAKIASLSEFSKPLAQFVGGLASVARQSAVGVNVNFLDGRISARGFPFYFFEAFAFKTGLPLLGASALALLLLLNRRFDRRDALLWMPAAYYFLFSIGSSYNIGVRHVLPVYPLLAIASSRLLVDLSTRGIPPRIPTAICAVLAAGQIGTAISAHPHELSYFNVFGGGTRDGYRHLCDSNSDWGLDLRRLAAELARRGIRDATICYFGKDDVFFRTGIRDFGDDPRVHGGLVAISTTMWDIGPAYYAVNGRGDASRALWDLIRRLKREEPIGRIGGSTLLFRLPPASPAVSAILPPAR